ncbi:hypothetical protein TSTA_000670 [Talaromyces stipitatus ATCC 10500]|uniref:Uncharacterized protein n=1 Tax=Talaromyces stipitatus (strain ATCC 10500 / CBS 375.48 / QM 6759 / NRRL 1006) TaxID=441959 RepID=B8MSV0_TALSN|nr:uncharacterized protein TSTA_000670 [Talaromyces stipitatus ATCC 10500]EED11993.1 hypothetical protein TSTA_000670 [Talaromyces stipitatus ATCC 10500]
MPPPQRRTARRELDPCMRARICELHTEAHWGYKRIHRAHPEIPISTIRNTIKKEQERINQRSMPRTGPPEKLTDENKQKLIELTIQYPHIKYMELRNAIDNKVTIRTIQGMFQKIHKRKWKCRNINLMIRRFCTPVQKQARTLVGLALLPSMLRDTDLLRCCEIGAMNLDYRGSVVPGETVVLTTVASAVYNMTVQASSIIGTNIYWSNDAPLYLRGSKVLIGIASLSLFLFLFAKVYYDPKNYYRARKWNAMSSEERDAYLAANKDSDYLHGSKGHTIFDVIGRSVDIRAEFPSTYRIWITSGRDSTSIDDSFNIEYITILETILMAYM